MFLTRIWQSSVKAKSKTVKSEKKASNESSLTAIQAVK